MLPIPDGFSSRNCRGGIQWTWRPIPTPAHPDGYRRLGHGGIEPAHKGYEVEVRHDGSASIHRTDSWAFTLGQLQDGEIARARVRAVSPQETGDWTEWSAGKAENPIEWSWSATIPERSHAGSSLISLIQVKEGDGISFHIPREYVPLVRKNGVEISAHRTYHVGGSGSGRSVEITSSRDLPRRENRSLVFRPGRILRRSASFSVKGASPLGDATVSCDGVLSALEKPAKLIWWVLGAIATISAV